MRPWTVIVGVDGKLIDGATPKERTAYEACRAYLAYLARKGKWERHAEIIMSLMHNVAVRVEDDYQL